MTCRRMTVGLPGICAPKCRLTICAPMDRLPVMRAPITTVTVLPRKKSACAKADVCASPAIITPAKMRASKLLRMNSSPAGRRLLFGLEILCHRLEHFGRLVHHLGEALGHVLRRNVLHVDLRLFRLLLELRIRNG